jgi:hypothetical protein
MRNALDSEPVARVEPAAMIQIATMSTRRRRPIRAVSVDRV